MFIFIVIGLLFCSPAFAATTANSPMERDSTVAQMRLSGTPAIRINGNPDGTYTIYQLGEEAVAWPPSSFVPPDLAGFALAVKAALGGVVGLNQFEVAYPSYAQSLADGAWADVQELIVDAQSKNIITPTQYAAIRSAATTYHIQITLP